MTEYGWLGNRPMVYSWIGGIYEGALTADPPYICMPPMR
jgi:hypothetical protein